MSQLVLDDQLDLQKIVPGLDAWITSTPLQAVRPGEHILDERVRELLLTMNRPTFVTIDADFWKRRLCHRGYCILYLGLIADEQHYLPELLRSTFRLSEFSTRAARMGKVARVQKQVITYWEWESDEKKILRFPEIA